MKKKKHFYHGRIRVLSMCFTFLMIGLLTSGIASAQGTIKEKITDIGKCSAVTAGLAFAPFAMVKQMKDDKKWDALDDTTKDYIEVLEKQLNAAFEASLKGVAKTDELEKLEKKLGPQLTTEEKRELTDMIQTVKDQAALIAGFKDSGISKVSDSLAETLKANSDKIKGFKKAGTTAKLEFELKSKFQATKAIAEQSAADIATHTIGLRVPGIGQIPTRTPFLRDLFTVVNCNLEYIKYIDQETIVRDAKNVASATASSHTSKITWKERSIQITNVRDMIDVPIDMMEDYDFVEGEARRLLDVNVQLKVDANLLTDDGVHPNMHSIDEKASEFSAANTLGGTIDAWAGQVKDPNIFDLVIAMTSQIIALGEDGAYMPNVVLFNTIDRYKALLLKDANNNYIMPPFVTRVGGRDYNIDGMIVRSNPLVPKNSIRVFDSTHGTIYSRKQAIFQVSYENNNNFETEVATLKVYERLNFLIRNTGANAFMKCSDVATALVALKAGV